MWTKITRTGLITLAAALALAGCKDGEKSGTAVKEGVSKSAEVVQKVDLSGTPIERMEKAIAFAKESKGEGVPSMWKMSDEDTDIYIFGTIHLLPDGVDWRTEKFDAVLEDMDALYVEADIESPEAVQKLGAAMMQASVNTEGSTLSELLGEDHAKLGTIFSGFGVPEDNLEQALAQLESLQPWMVGMNVGLTQIQQLGYNPESGVESVLLAKAKDKGVNVGFMEDGVVQINAFSAGTMEEQADALKMQLATFDRTKDQMDALLGEWADGDENGIGIMLANSEIAASENAYNLLLKDRNIAWIPNIEAILDDPGTKLVAVGAAHLAGPDSVITMLEANGHKVEVVQ